MKILHTEWSDGWGGQEIRILEDARVLTRFGHRVILAGCPEGGLARHVKAENLPFVDLRFRSPFDPLAVFHLVRLIRREGIQVVNTHSSVDSWAAGLAAKITGVPVLVRTRHLSVPIATHRFNVVYRWPDAIVTTADTIRKRLVEVNRIPAERVLNIPTGVDLSRFDPSRVVPVPREALGLAPSDRVVAMVAVLRSWKRHETLLEAAALMAPDRPGLKVLIVGDGPGLERVTAKIRELNLEDRVVMTGHRTDIPEILASVDACALTSEAAEGVPQSVLQYQAMARPAVGTTAGGIPEVIEDGVSGLLCPINDPPALAAALARILDDPDLADRLGRAGRKSVEERHSMEAMAQATLDLYTRIHRAKTGRNP